MKSSGLKYIIHCLPGLVATVIMMVSLVSCGGDTPACEDETGKMIIAFRVSAPDPRYSRANDGYDDGTYLESAIDFEYGSYRVYFFDTQDRFIAEWNPVIFIHVLTGSDGNRIYKFEGNIPEKLKDYSDFSVMVLANWPEYPDYRGVNLEGKTISEVIKGNWAKFNAFSSYELSEEDHRLIPFYGLTAVSGKTFEKNKTTDLGTINLLRAVAKVEVTVDAGSLFKYVSINEEQPLTICGINPSGYCATTGSIGTGNNWDTDYVTELHLPFENNKNHPLAMNNSMPMLRLKDAGGADTNTWIAYVPEFRNKDEEHEDHFSHIELRLDFYDNESKSGKYETRTFELYFSNYSEGHTDNKIESRYDIKRNDLYRFSVKGGLLGIEPKLHVEEWNFRKQDEIIM